MKAHDLRNALEVALHALVSTDGLVVTDRPDLLPEDFKKDYTWKVENTDALEEITLAIKQLGFEAKDAARVWSISNFLTSSCDRQSNSKELELLAAVGMCVIRAAARDSKNLSSELEGIFSSIQSKNGFPPAVAPQQGQAETAQPLNRCRGQE